MSWRIVPKRRFIEGHRAWYSPDYYAVLGSKYLGMVIIRRADARVVDRYKG